MDGYLNCKVRGSKGLNGQMQTVQAVNPVSDIYITLYMIISLSNYRNHTDKGTVIAVTQPTQDFHPLLVQCLISVADSGLTLNQR